MQADIPHTLYRPIESRGNGKSGKRRYRVNPDDPAFAKAQEAYERALARRQAKIDGKIPYRMDELYR